jgi:hypothetical protein
VHIMGLQDFKNIFLQGNAYNQGEMNYLKNFFLSKLYRFLVEPSGIILPDPDQTRSGSGSGSDWGSFKHFQNNPKTQKSGKNGFLDISKLFHIVPHIRYKMLR